MTAGKFRPGRFLVATTGSLGDIHPYLALGTAMQSRGHRFAIATATEHRQAVEQAGLTWHRMRPEGLFDPSVAYRSMHPTSGLPYVMDHHICPSIGQSYSDLAAIAAEYDVVISTPLSFAAPILAERLSLPWASVVLQPMGFHSLEDPPVIGGVFERLTRLLQPAGAPWGRVMQTIGRQTTRSWRRSIRAFRNEVGLGRGDDPLFEGHLSPHLVLGLFPKALLAQKNDLPAQARVTGAVFWDDRTATPPQPCLESFLRAGPPPLVFALGTAAVHAAGRFYDHSLMAAQAIGQRAILLIGRDPINRARLPNVLPDNVLVLPYAPYIDVFPKAAAIIHQGGIGTLAQAMRAGRPMLVVPFGFDQPDNAARAERLGVAHVLPSARYTAASATRALRRLLADPAIPPRAAQIARAVKAEDGIRDACEALEALLSLSTPRHASQLVTSAPF